MISFQLHIDYERMRTNIFSKFNNKFIAAIQRGLREPLPLRRANRIEDAHGIRARWKTSEEEYASS